MSATVLIVEDDPVILRLLEVNFEMEGFAVLTAHDGEQGFEIAQAKRPDLVISDIMMPKKSGIELITELRENAKTKKIPIILLSAKAQANDVREGLAAGADDYVTKPFEPLELVDRVNALLAKRRA